MSSKVLGIWKNLRNTSCLHFFSVFFLEGLNKVTSSMFETSQKTTDLA